MALTIISDTTALRVVPLRSQVDSSPCSIASLDGNNS